MLRDRTFRSRAPIPYLYTLVAASPGDHSPERSTLPPDFFEAETPHSAPTEPPPSISETSQNQLRSKREEMLRPTWTVHEASCLSNVYVTREGGNTVDIHLAEWSSRVGGHIITEWSHLGEILDAKVYILDPEAVSDQENPCPLSEPAKDFEQEWYWRNDNNGTLSLFEVYSKPEILEGIQHESGKTHLYPYLAQALRPSRPDIMPKGWKPKPKPDTSTEDPPNPHHSLHDSNPSLPHSTIS